LSTRCLLARVLRYGDVRGTDVGTRRLRWACRARRRRGSDGVSCSTIGRCGDGRTTAGVQAALALVDHPARRSQWPAVLTVIAERGDVHGLVQAGPPACRTRRI
jgi:hypothetical protein